MPGKVSGSVEGHGRFDRRLENGELPRLAVSWVVVGDRL